MHWVIELFLIRQLNCLTKLYYQKKFVGGKECDHCGNMNLFHSKYSINMND